MSAQLINPATASSSSKSRFPRLQECAHFHYEVNTVELPKNFRVVMCGLESNLNNENGSDGLNFKNSESSSSGSTNIWFQLQVTCQEKRWIIYRTYENFRYLDKYLHDCIFDRKFSDLEELGAVNYTSAIQNSAEMFSVSPPISSDPMTASITSNNSNTLRRNKQLQNSDLAKQLRQSLATYLNRFCDILFVNPINCGPILNWFEIDNRGNRLFAIDDSPINIPGVAAAVVKKRYVSQALDELSLEVGNMISVIDMPPAEESIWWRGKKELEVGFFPADCVDLIKSNFLNSNSSDQMNRSGQNQSGNCASKNIQIFFQIF
jgi:hypothetical protein